MADLEARFQAAAAAARELEGVDQTMQLRLYGLFKQSTVGDVEGDRPGLLNLTGAAKWDAWKENEGVDTETAMTNYIACVTELKPDWEG